MRKASGDVARLRTHQPCVRSLREAARRCRVRVDAWTHASNVWISHGTPVCQEVMVNSPPPHTAAVLFRVLGVVTKGRCLEPRESSTVTQVDRGSTFPFRRSALDFCLGGQRSARSMRVDLWTHVVYSNVQWFRGGLVFEAHRLIHQSAQVQGPSRTATRVKKKKKGKAMCFLKMQTVASR